MNNIFNSIGNAFSALLGSHTVWAVVASVVAASFGVDPSLLQVGLGAFGIKEAGKWIGGKKVQ